MRSLFLSTAAVVAGLVTAFIFLIAVEIFSGLVYPFPDGFKGTTEEVCLHVANYPTWILVTVVPLWAATGGIGGWIAKRIANRVSAVIVCLLFFAAILTNILMLPYAVWFKVTCPLAVAAVSLFSLREKNFTFAERKATSESAL